MIHNLMNRCDRPRGYRPRPSSHMSRHNPLSKGTPKAPGLIGAEGGNSPTLPLRPPALSAGCHHWGGGAMHRVERRARACESRATFGVLGHGACCAVSSVQCPSCRELPSQSAAQMGPCSLPLAWLRFVVGEHRGRRASWRLVYGAKGGGVGVCRSRRCKVSRRRPKMKLSLTIARVSDSGSVLLGVFVLS